MSNMLCAARQKALLHTAMECVSLPGAFVELGVFDGGSALILLSALTQPPAAPIRLHLFDSWQGLSAPHPGRDPDRLQRGDLQIDCPAWLIAAPVFIHAGFIQDTLNQLPPAIAFAHLDLDLWEPTALGLAQISRRLARGGRIIVDDYHADFAGVKLAVDDFLEQHPDWSSEIIHGRPHHAIKLWPSDQSTNPFIPIIH